jgi:hypothetical protein
MGILQDKQAPQYFDKNYGQNTEGPVFTKQS